MEMQFRLRGWLDEIVMVRRGETPPADGEPIHLAFDDFEAAHHSLSRFASHDENMHTLRSVLFAFGGGLDVWRLANHTVVEAVAHMFACGSLVPFRIRPWAMKGLAPSPGSPDKKRTSSPPVPLPPISVKIVDPSGKKALKRVCAKGGTLAFKAEGAPSGGTYTWTATGSFSISGGNTGGSVTVRADQTSSGVEDSSLTVQYSENGRTANDTVKLTAVTVSKLQYKVNGVWKDVPSPLGPLCQGSAAEFQAIITPAGAPLPAGAPVWSGEASGNGKVKRVTFANTGARTVAVELGDRKQVDVKVANPNAPVTITWQHGYTVDNANASATTRERAFNATYEACADIEKNEWHLRVKSIEGGTDIAVHMGGYQTPQPGVNITTQVQAVAAINDMLLEGAVGGPASTWVTEAAIATHEEWHKNEWIKTCEHYWPTAETALEELKVAYDAHENSAANAITAMRSGGAGADAKIAAFKQKCRDYWFTLGDSPGDRPYRAGGVVMNAYIQAVRAYGATQAPAWVLPAGSNPAPGADHPYQPWLPYAP